jgi:hypothetical protein
MNSIFTIQERNYIYMAALSVFQRDAEEFKKGMCTCIAIGIKIMGLHTRIPLGCFTLDFKNNFPEFYAQKPKFTYSGFNFMNNNENLWFKFTPENNIKRETILKNCINQTKT